MLVSVSSRAALVVTFLAAWVGSAPGADPPRVVRTTPALGAADVDPETTQLSITFDQKMGPGYSVVGNRALQPIFTDQPAWDEPKLTCTIDFKLEPGRYYQLQINGPGATNFRSDPDREPAVPFLLSFHTAPVPADEPVLQPVDRVANQAALDVLRTALHTQYSHFDRLGLDWDQLVDSVADDLIEAPTPYTFATRLALALRPAQDPHLSVAAGTHVFPTHFTTAVPNFNLRSLGHYVQDIRPVSSAIFAGHVSDSIAYMCIATWDASHKSQILPALDEITRFADTSAFIFDARPNGGGDESLAKRIAARFASKTVVYARHQWRDPHEPTGFGPVIDRMLEPDSKNPTYKGQVIVLTGPTNMSSNEAFILMMKAAGATIVGEKTFGSSGNPKPIALGNGVTLMCPAWKALLPDGKPLEGAGITPDVVVEAPLMTMRADDPILQAAIELVADPFKH